MQDPYTILRNEAEPVAEWLLAYTAGQPFPRRKFFSSRVVFYPGSGDDGHPLKLFGGTHSAHCFVFADCGVSQETFERALSDPEFKSKEGHPRFPKGYQSLSLGALRRADVAPRGWPRAPDFEQSELRFALWAVLERKAEFGEDHGPSRIAILVIGAEAIVCFDVLFCRSKVRPPPYAIVVQDHGLGGNSPGNEFGGEGSRLWKLAEPNPPRWLLVAQGGGTRPWPGYKRMSAVDCGGMHGNARALFARRLDNVGA
jgi:hypothetical protein